LASPLSSSLKAVFDDELHDIDAAQALPQRGVGAIGRVECQCEMLACMPMKVKELLALIEADGWVQVR
jgi:hypothetical protein